MAHVDRQTRIADILADERGVTALHAALPQLFEHPGGVDAVAEMLIGTLLDYGQVPDERAAELFDALTVIELPDRVEDPAILPDPAYESDDVERASATLIAAPTGEQYATYELCLDGPSHGNPFVDVDLWVEFECHDESVRVGGFYDGGGRYRVRFLPPAPGEWRFRTESTARSLDGIEGTAQIGPATGAGPVRANGFHFAYADGSAYTPFGTTLYAWTHQEAAREEQTLATLTTMPFTKVRMCVFPKHYDFNNEEPPRFPFAVRPDGSWDTTRFNVEFFRHLEQRIGDLGDLGIQADLILFHPYDRWGFADLGVAADDRYVQYIVRRLAGLPNVWWSLANEYDLMGSKRQEDWERIGAAIAADDHAHHLLSIHNGTRIYDFTADWITHASIQKTDPSDPTPHVSAWREAWHKPVVIDEAGYEGDISLEWGSLSAQELIRRFWRAFTRGGYLTHGETYLSDDERMWWATGGALTGSSPARIALLADIVRSAGARPLDPLTGYPHVHGVGVRGEYEVHYFDHYQPRVFTFAWPAGEPAAVDIIDTWSMDIDTKLMSSDGSIHVDLPARSDIAVRIRRAAEND